MVNIEHPDDLVTPATTNKRISHATTNAAVVDELLAGYSRRGGFRSAACLLLLSGGLRHSESKNFYERLKLELTADVLVLFGPSPDFSQSLVCLCEIGATWVFNKEHVPVLVSPFDFGDMRGVIPATQGLKLTDKLKVTELMCKVARHYGLPDPAHHTDWERCRDKSLSRIEQLFGQRAAQ